MPSTADAGRSEGSSCGAATDQAIVPALEAIIIGLLVGGVILFSVAFQAPPPPSEAAGPQDLETISRDVLRSLDTMRYPDSAYNNNTLSKAVADALAGNDTNLTVLFERYLPPGAAYNIYLNNGHGRVVLHEDRKPTGQTVGVSYPFEPKWTTVYTEPDIEVRNDEDGLNTMGTTIVPVLNSNLVRDQGHLVRATFNGTQSWLPGQSALNESSTWTSFVEDAHTTLHRGDPTSTSLPSVSLYMLCNDDDPAVVKRPCYAVDISEEMHPDFHAWDFPTLSFVAENAGPGTMEAGTEIKVHLPVGLSVDSTATPLDRWQNLQVLGTPPHPQEVVATLASDLATGETAMLNITIDDDALDTRYVFKTVGATLKDGAVSHSQFLIKQSTTNHPDTVQTGGDTRVVYLSTPKPAGSGTSATGRWGVVMPVPAAEMTVSNLTLQLLDGQRAIQSVAYPSDFDPGNSVDPSNALDPRVTDGTLAAANGYPTHQVTWQAPGGSMSVDANKFIELQFEITSTDEAVPGSHRFPFLLPKAVFDGFSPPPNMIQIEDGVWWAEHPPAIQGLPGVPNEDSTFTARQAHRNSLLTGVGDYSSVAVSDADEQRKRFHLGSTGGEIYLKTDAELLKLKDALQAGRMVIAERNVPVGNTASMRLEVRDLANYVSSEYGVNNLDLTTHIYPPWGIRDRIPVTSFTHEAAGGSSTVPHDIDLSRLDADTLHDVLVASATGNVYGLSGKTGGSLAQKTWSVPESASGVTPAQPKALARGLDNGVPFWAVGTNNVADSVYGVEMNGAAGEVWQHEKAEAESDSLAVNASTDLNGDGVNDVIMSQQANQAASNNPAGHSRLKLIDGSTGQLMGPVWATDLTNDTYGVTVNGTATQLGMGLLGPTATEGIWSNTGLKVGVEVETATFEMQPEELEDPKADDIDPTDPDLPAHLDLGGVTVTTPKSPGLIGIRDDGRWLWNLTGARITRAMNAEHVPTGGNWTGIVAGGGDGWVYGLSGEKPITPVWGLEHPVWPKFLDIAGANALEGYMISDDGEILTTRDGWTSMDWYYHPVTDALAYPDARAVDTPGGSYRSAPAGVSWWVGENGMIVRSTDRLNTVDEFSGMQALVSSAVTLDGTNANLNLPDLDTISLSNVDFEDVYAVSADEAWFVGKGSGGDVEDQGVIAYTDDGGSTLMVTTIDCSDGITPIACGLNGIDFDGQRYWAVGANGTVLTNRVGGQLDEVSFVSADDEPETDTGVVRLNVSVDAQTEVRTISVDWSPSANLDWMRDVKARVDGSVVGLWEKDNLQAATAVESGTYDATNGISDGAVLNLTTFDDNTGNANDNVWQSEGIELRLGPFKKTLTPLTGYYSETGNQDIPTPTNLTVTLTYDDGTQDSFVVGLGPNGQTDREVSRATWSTPADEGFIVPDTCFGQPEADCVNYHSINITTPHGASEPIGYIVGQRRDSAPVQSSIVRYVPGTSAWLRVDDVPVTSELHDVAVSMWNQSKAVVVGDNDRVLITYDLGQTWTDLPKVNPLSQGPIAPFYAVEFNHPDVANMVGGNDASALRFTLDGYTEWGRVTTVDLHPGGPGVDPIKWLGIDARNFTLSDATVTTVHIEVLDDGTWKSLYSTDDGYWPSDVAALPSQTAIRELDSTTSEIKLRTTLRTPGHGFSRFSAQLYGQLELRGYADSGSDPSAWNDHHVSLTTWDINNTAQIASGIESVNATGGPHGVIRLKAVHNPWVHKLGNPDAQWGDTFVDPTTGDVVSKDSAGARVADIALSPDGHTLYVGTEGIYVIGAAEGEHRLGWDNTVYALNVTTGKRVGSWPLTQLTGSDGSGDAEPIWMMEAYEGGLYVVVHNASEKGGPPVLWQLDDQGTRLSNYTVSAGSTVVDLEVGRIHGTDADDAVLAVSSSNGGAVIALRSQSLEEMWDVNPGINGIFQFDYPVPLSALYGAYITESQFQWSITDDVGSEITQTARIHNAFQVTPKDRQAPLSPTYTLEVVAWMEDWG